MLPTKPPLDPFPYPRHPESRPFSPDTEPGSYVFVQSADGVVHVVPEPEGHLHPRVLGGLGYGWRRWMSPDQGLALLELEGSLGGGDVEALAVAGGAALATLMGQGALAGVNPNGWGVTVGAPGQRDAAPAR